MRLLAMTVGLWGLGACTTVPNDVFSDVLEPIEIEVTRGVGPPDADPNACYGRQTTPAVVETVTEQVMLQPAQVASDGRVLEQAVFVTETQQRIVESRRELWFQTPCEATTDPEFIASLQRALAARDIYRGSITGRLDQRTRRAIRAYQAPQGLDSAVLSLAAARQLGIALWNPALTQGRAGG
ncbi:MAG: peptidoglycan-binding domain-containing protein [Pseudomonadota bacterium]